MDLGLGWWELPEHENYQAWLCMALAALGHILIFKLYGRKPMDAYFGEETLQKASPHFGDMNRYMMLYNIYIYLHIYFLINRWQSSKKIFLFAKNPGS